MSTTTPERRSGLVRPALVVLCLVGGIAAWYRGQAPGPVSSALLHGTAPSSRSAASSATPPPAQPGPTAPSFDVVRIGPSGNAVLAGRAAPGAEVVVRDGGQELGRTRADGRGEWVLLPDAPFQPGGRELTLSSRDAAGMETRGQAPVLLVVPDPIPAPSASRPAVADAGAAKPTPVPPIALLVPPGGAPFLLQAPPAAPVPPTGQAGAQPGAGAARPPGRLNMDVVDYTDGGDIRFSGTAPPGAPVRVYVDNAPAGDAVADAQGRWSMTPREAMGTGVHWLRVDQITGQGRVQARVELPFQRATLPAGAVPEGRVVVQPGQNLWRLARTAYGTGVRYTVIYRANRDQIRDPNRIYPGQTFDVPGL